MDSVIDVLIPAYNTARTIESAVASIQAQTVRDIRIVVVDDGSTDDTAARVERLAASDQRIELVRRANGGIVDALNDGLARCTAPLVARHDGDDIAHPDRFEKQKVWLDAHPDCVAVGAAARHIGENGQPLGHVARFLPPEGADPIAAPSREPYIVHPLLMARRDAMNRVGGYRYAFHAEDTDLYWRLQEIGTLHNLDDVLLDYRLHGASITSASVVNGRISAMYSQLSSLSAARRRSGRPDLDLPRSALEACKTARTSDEIYRIGAALLAPDERDRLRIMLAGKIMMLASFRPFELDRDDCRFVASARASHLGLLTPSNRAAFDMTTYSTAARLVSKGRLAEAQALVGPRDWPHVATRLAFRTLTTPRLRSLARRAIGRPDHVK